MLETKFKLYQLEEDYLPQEFLRANKAVIMTLLAMKRNIPFEQSHTIEVDNASPIEFSIEELEGIRERL